MSARDMFRDMGIPIPPPITVKPLSRPIYNNQDIQSFLVWRQTNLQALTDYWNSLVPAEEAHILMEEDFNLFMLAQYDSEMDRRDEYKRAYGSMRDNL